MWANFEQCEDDIVTQPVRFEPKMLHPEQLSEPKEPSEPWLRQKGESARLYMWFRRYLDLGPKRSLRKALAAEPGTQRVTEGNKNQAEPQKKLSDVSVPGAWSRASKVWHWVERAEAYDLDQQAIQAAGIRQVASCAPHASKAYRVMQLDYLARILQEKLKPGTVMERKDLLALMARYQSVMRDMAAEMECLGVAIDSVDSAAFEKLAKEAEQQEIEEKQRDASRHERNKAIFEKYDQES